MAYGGPGPAQGLVERADWKKHFSFIYILYISKTVSFLCGLWCLSEVRHWPCRVSSCRMCLVHKWPVWTSKFFGALASRARWQPQMIQSPDLLRCGQSSSCCREHSVWPVCHSFSSQKWGCRWKQFEDFFDVMFLFSKVIQDAIPEALHIWQICCEVTLRPGCIEYSIIMDNVNVSFGRLPS